MIFVKISTHLLMLSRTEAAPALSSYSLPTYINISKYREIFSNSFLLLAWQPISLLYSLLKTTMFCIIAVRHYCAHPKVSTSKVRYWWMDTTNILIQHRVLYVRWWGGISKLPLSSINKDAFVNCCRSVGRLVLSSNFSNTLPDIRIPVFKVALNKRATMCLL